MEWRVPWPCGDGGVSGRIGVGIRDANAAFDCDAHGRCPSLRSLNEFNLVGSKGRFCGCGGKAFLKSEMTGGKRPRHKVLETTASFTRAGMKELAYI